MSKLVNRYIIEVDLYWKIFNDTRKLQLKVVLNLIIQKYVHLCIFFILYYTSQDQIV